MYTLDTNAIIYDLNGDAAAVLKVQGNSTVVDDFQGEWQKTWEER